MHKGASPSGFKLELNPSLGTPLYRQIMDGIRELIAVKALKPGDQLPSIRELAAQLRINPSSAVKAYGELRHAQVIEIDHGRGTYVRADAQVVASSRIELVEAMIESVVTRAHTLGVSDEVLMETLKRRLKTKATRGQS